MLAKNFFILKYLFLFVLFFCFGFYVWMGVVEHLGDLRTERREDGRVEERMSGKDNTADDNADDDFDAGVDVAFTGGGGAVLAEMTALFFMEASLDLMLAKNFFIPEYLFLFLLIFCLMMADYICCMVCAGASACSVVCSVASS